MVHGEPQISPLDKSSALIALGEEILSALDAVEAAARSALSSDSPALAMPTLAYSENPMAGENRAERFVAARNAEARKLIRLLLTEPFIARVKVDWGPKDRGVQTLYFPARSAGGLSTAIKGAYLVSYLEDLGRLAEYRAGEIAEIEVNGHERTGQILECSHIEPSQHDQRWDALAEAFSALPWGDLLGLIGRERLRAVLERIAREASSEGIEDLVGQLEQMAAEAERERQRLRRKVIDRITLRNRAILDRFQGDVFRLPLNRQVLLLGPPGSGKTTTLIKRLAQKRTPEALPNRERELLSTYVREILTRNDSWAMFSPAELLKQYLGDAFNKIGVPDASNVRTWDQERHDLARNVFSILRSPTGGRFQSEPHPGLLLDPSSPGIAALHDDFADRFETALLQRCNVGLEGLLSADDEGVRRSAQNLRRRLGSTGQLDLADMARLLDSPDDLQIELRRLEGSIATDVRTIANGLLNRHRSLPDEITAEMRTFLAEQQEEDGEERDEEGDTPSAGASVSPVYLLQTALRNWARTVAEKRRTLGGRSGRIIRLIGDRLPPEEAFAAAGRKLILSAHLRALLQAPRRFVLGPAGFYASFRRDALKEGRHFSASDAVKEFVSGNKISPDEIDVLVLVMLRHARRLLASPGPERLELVTGHEWLERIKGRYLVQVFVDEATDLSAVQLACTVELAFPKLRSWFACGDFRQRLTRSGIQSRPELDWLVRTTGVRLDPRDINIGYRQSRKLRELSDDLGALLDGATTSTAAPSDEEEAGVPPLLVENITSADTPAWLARRIREVELAVGSVPAIAIFVDGDGRVAPLAQALQTALAPWNFVVKGRLQDSTVGDPREVRVFDVNNVKGMEFEAVFFVSIDDLASRVPDLFARFLYVGLTRAATYLGVTCEGSLPPSLSTIRRHFAADGWS
ncbi:ATP-binding domain-containing protein [Bradyrhizobium diazoefficiens]|nr:ATP-binding domain-containing protein [Bradyrhizobium diazoefficiens]MBR0848435.1 ATP-binding domain-containing protein [Bradyrhizobium diazoefficiens]